MTEEPLAYKFVGVYYTWMCEEYEDSDIPEIQPLYSPIEDEE